MDMWKLREYTRERARLRRLAVDAHNRVDKLIGEFETYPDAVRMTEGGDYHCPHCNIHAYHSESILHKCAACRRYYYVNFTRTTP